MILMQAISCSSLFSNEILFDSMTQEDNALSIPGKHYKYMSGSPNNSHHNVSEAPITEVCKVIAQIPTI